MIGIKDKRGAELSLNVVIIAAICLIVLIVLIVVFSSKTKTFSLGSSDCGTMGGICQTAACGEGYAKVTFAKCSQGSTYNCCKPAVGDCVSFGGSCIASSTGCGSKTIIDGECPASQVCCK